MDRRLPPLRDMVNMPQVCGTAPPPNASWTAINHPQEAPGSVSPPTHHANPHVHGHLSPSSHRQDHGDRQSPQHDHLLPNSCAVAPNEPKYPRLSFTGRFSSGEHHPAGKPTTARQDSVVFPYATSQIPATVPSGNSPETHYRPVLRDATNHPLTPPSDPSSTHASGVSTHSSLYDRQREVPPARPQQEDATIARGRSHSDATRSAAPPLPHAALFTDGRDSMPPPPVPISAPTQPPESVTPGTPSPLSSAGTSQSTSKHQPDSSNAEEEGPVKCVFCHATWSFPPPDIKSVPKQTPLTYSESLQDMDALSTFASNYRARKDADYEKWKQRHSGGHCHCTEPQPGNKRKVEASLDDDSPPLKSRRRSSESPPRRSRLTPPPEHTADEAAPAPLYFEAQHGPPIPLGPSVARIFGMTGESRYIPPADDSNNMFYDAHGERKRVKTEETAH